MFWQTQIRHHPEFRQGFQDQRPVAMGMAAWGLMTGVAMVKAGLTPLSALMVTLIVYAGSAQLATVPLLVSGAPLWVVWATAFCVNLRFVVFSAHLRPYWLHLSLWQRMITGYVTTDLSYVFFVRRYPTPPPLDAPDIQKAQQAYLMGTCFINYAAWMSASVVGVFCATLIPTAWGMGFAGILALVGVLLSMVHTPLRGVAAGIAMMASVLALSLPLKLHIVVSIVWAVVICLWFERFITKASS